MGQAMGQNLKNDIVKNILAFPSCRRLGQDTNEYSLRPFLQDNSSIIAEIQRINVGDILSDLNPKLQQQQPPCRSGKYFQLFMDAPYYYHKHQCKF